MVFAPRATFRCSTAVRSRAGDPASALSQQGPESDLAQAQIELSFEPHRIWVDLNRSGRRYAARWPSRTHETRRVPRRRRIDDTARMQHVLKRRDDLSVRVLIDHDIHDACFDVVAMQIEHFMSDPHDIARRTGLAQRCFDARRAIAAVVNRANVALPERGRHRVITAVVIVECLETLVLACEVTKRFAYLCTTPPMRSTCAR